MKDDKPSLTAVMVAYTVLVLGGDDYGRSQLPPGILEAQIAVLVAAGLPFGTCPWVLCNPLWAVLTRWIAALCYPGFFQGIGFRKLIIECQVRDFLRQTNTATTRSNSSKQPQQQVVVVAAGYDTLAMRLCREYPLVTFWEVDHPATSRVKERVWTNDKAGTTTQPHNMQHVQADLTKTRLHYVLQAQPEYNPALPTIVIVEGLTMYLTEPQIRGLFHDIELCTTTSPPCSSSSLSSSSEDNNTNTNTYNNNATTTMVVFDFFGWNEQRQQVDVGWMLPNLHRFGFTGGAEPWIWGLPPDKLEQFFADTHWKLVGNVEHCGYENVAAMQLQLQPTLAAQ